MTWYFDPTDTTLTTVEYADGRGNVFTVASNIEFSGTWEIAPDKARQVAISWIINQAANGNTQTALTALAELEDERWEVGTPQ